MNVIDFVNKHNIGLLGDKISIRLNLIEIGEMLRNHTLDEVTDIIHEMCNLE